MNDAALLRARVAECNAKYPTSHVAPPQAEQFVGADAEPMSDAEREDAIHRAGNAMQAWYSHYKATGDPRMLDMAYAAMGLQKRLLSERSPQYVAKLEQERGLA